MKLPGGAHAVVEISKLRDYCLNPHHPRGRHKARVFLAALDLSQSDAGILRTALLEAARQEVATPAETDQYGARYTVDFVLVHAGRKAIVRSSWIILHSGALPRLTSCFVL